MKEIAEHLTQLAIELRMHAQTPELLPTAERRGEAFRNVANHLDKTAAEIQAPVPMILTCPSCGERHIDRGDFATKVHHTHACQGCGMVWRPAIVPTVGVQFLPGFKDGYVTAEDLARTPDRSHENEGRGPTSATASRRPDLAWRPGLLR
jgi:predicted RNA-binding Zn-ribbon protein involved in translation (DUF1610 family)